MKGTFTVNGHRVRTSSQRRFVVFAVAVDGSQQGILKRSDSAATARMAATAARHDRSRWDVFTVDTVTGETI